MLGFVLRFGFVWGRFRCLRYWLQGEKRGQTEIFIENLPGGPDNINLAPDGSFWIALLQVSILCFIFWFVTYLQQTKY